ncbi:hypothetical protein WJ55_10795 [Burkholderia ubonensis]|nr:hypothetical protein WJ34_31520 [Burkholderia ubonensis]KVH18388.1 hypothetical protein WJ37_03605 [Burkholderia ubonensis]KVH49208.1 hypothetical protein WJ38_15665 [Burkholderia ubonensis]KVH84575.1 hypothetical protein WJ43_00930 [Burkholderia ubonensis]KVM36867.1 hypothetical protein WJ55_10795 [Burkholderia ubonensis]
MSRATRAAAHAHAVQIVARIELQAALIGRYDQLAAAFRIVDARDRPDRTRAVAQHEAVIEAARPRELRMRPVEARAERRALPEIESRAGHVRGAGRDQRVVDFEERVGVDAQHVAAHVAARAAAEVEVAVIREVERRRRIGDAGVVDRQRAVVVERVANLHAHVARKARVAFWRIEPQRQPAAVVDDFPALAVKAARAAVQQIAVLVAIEQVVDAVEREARAGDPVRPAADRRAEVDARFDIFGGRIVREHDIGEASGAVGREPRHDGRAEVADDDAHPVRVAQRVAPHRVAVGQRAPRLGMHA